MAKHGTSRTRGAFWSAKPRRLKETSTAIPHDPTVSLRNTQLVRAAILDALAEGDFEAVSEIYRAHLRVLNRTRTAKAMKVSRTYIYKMMKARPNPSLRTFTAFMRALATSR